MLLAALVDAIQPKNPGFKVRWMTWLRNIWQALGRGGEPAAAAVPAAQPAAAVPAAVPAPAAPDPRTHTHRWGVQVERLNPVLDLVSNWFQCSKHETTAFKFAFNFNVRLYAPAPPSPRSPSARSRPASPP